MELGIEDAFTADGESMKCSLAAQLPIFAGLKFDLERKLCSKIIFATSDRNDKFLINSNSLDG